MKRAKNFKAFVLLCIVAVFVMAVSAGAATPREMIENGEVSDGSVVYGDKRDGIVSDVSSDMSDIGAEVSEFVETVLPDKGTTTHETSGVEQNSDMTVAESTTGAANNDNAGMTQSGATWGIVIAVIVAIAVIALIFFFVKRK